MFAMELENIKDDPERVNNLFLYAALEELHILQEFVALDYCLQPKHNICIVMHLFHTSVPKLVYEKQTVGDGRDTLHLTRFETGLSDHKSSLEHLETSVGSSCVHLKLPVVRANN